MDRPQWMRWPPAGGLRATLLLMAALVWNAAAADEPSSRRTARASLPGPLAFETGHDLTDQPAGPPRRSELLSEPGAPLAPLPLPAPPSPPRPLESEAVPAAPPDGSPPAHQAAQPQLWLLSSRNAACGGLPCEAEFVPETFGYQGPAGWCPLTWDDFLAADDPLVPTMIYVHGNRHSFQTSAAQGLRAFAAVQQQACQGQRVRFVVWSWPSDPIDGGFRLDAQVKACRTDVESYYLATVLARMRPDQRIGLVGYSFGARVISGALHVLAGGAIEGLSLDGQAIVPRVPPRAVLLAPAMDHDVFRPGGKYDLALVAADRIAFTVNHEDFVLKFYPFLCSRKGPQAVGRIGATGLEGLGDLTSKLVIHDVYPFVHRRHGSQYYLTSEAIMALVKDEILGDPARPQEAPE